MSYKSETLNNGARDAFKTISNAVVAVEALLSNNATIVSENLEAIRAEMRSIFTLLSEAAKKEELANATEDAEAILWLKAKD